VANTILINEPKKLKIYSARDLDSIPGIESYRRLRVLK